MHIPDEHLLSLLSTTTNAGNEILDSLRDEFRAIPGTPKASEASKIALRITRGPTGGCINFHCDGGYATGTVQVVLSEASEYTGGRPCFFVNDHLHVLERSAASVCQHPPKVLHAVTALEYGARKSLFVVDVYNGLGEEGVVEVCESHVQGFLATCSLPQVQKCCLCLTLPSNHAMLPCGHLCVCADCAAYAQIDACPVCRGEVEQITIIFV